jgi:hypothetical protein
MEPNRISVSLGRKINLGNYESYDFHVSYSSDVGCEESNDEAYQRVTEQVQSWANQEEYKAIRLRDSRSKPKTTGELRLPSE